MISRAVKIENNSHAYVFPVNKYMYISDGLIAITRGMYQDRPDPPEIKHLEQISKQLEQQGKCRFLKRATDHVYFNKDPYNIYFYSPIE